MAFLGDRVENRVSKDHEIPLLLFTKYTQLSIFWAHSSIALLCLSEISVVMWMVLAMKCEQCEEMTRIIYRKQCSIHHIPFF